MIDKATPMKGWSVVSGRWVSGTWGRELEEWGTDWLEGEIFRS